MRGRHLAWLGVLAGIACTAPPAHAARFNCPHVGGTFTFGQEANVNSLDMMVSSAISTRNIAMNIFETLVTRGDDNHPILELANSLAQSPDKLTYTFKLRQGVQVPKRQEIDLDGRPRLIRALQPDRTAAQHVG